VEKLIGVLIKRFGREGDGADCSSWLHQGLGKCHWSEYPCEPFAGRQTAAFLGWDSSELDYHTLELATAFFEAEDLKGWENKPAHQFQINF
jgi:hypothetical protein